jgi:predicted nucleotidyltransferase
MITETDKKTILEISKKYRAKRVLLFGSSLKPERESRDIDIAVEGIQPKDFFSYYGDLMFSLSKPVDIVDISGTSKFIKLILKKGVPLYG